MKLTNALFLLCCCFAQAARSQDSLSDIRLDQEGFYPDGPKLAVLVYAGEKNAFCANKAVFYIIGEDKHDTVFTGRLSSCYSSANSGLKTKVADFTPLTRTGSFRVSVTGYKDSYVFRIARNVHHASAVASLKAFYFQRASMPLESRYVGKWARPAGHPDTLVLIHASAASEKRKQGAYISTPGGWYDAGDYNKYVVNSGISTATLLSAYADFKKYFDTLRTNIPALVRPIPDILNEALYNLRWMLSMQDPADGGVYNKCTNASFDKMVMPAEADMPRYVVQKGTAAALDLAAVAAKAAGIFKSFEKELPGFSDSCLRASEKAWEWARAHPELAYDQDAINKTDSPKIVTGGYGDRKFSDEWFWAAAELFIVTGKENYKDSLTRLINGHFPLPSWSETGLLGYFDLLKNPRDLRVENDTILARVQRMADDLLAGSKKNAFLTAMGSRKSDFNWGSNANAANQGILLLQVYQITHDQKYLQGALGNLDYILGRNATGFCFVTGIGTKSTRHPHHRPSVADGIEDPVPGFLAGGPNPGEQDHCHYDFHEPETAYADIDCAYASNEIAINWNAPLVYLANAAEAFQGSLKISVAHDQ